MPEALNGFKIYPRGFAGRELPVRLAERPKPYEIRIRSQRQVGMLTPTAQVLDANQVIEVLYSQYIKNSADTLSSEFREAVLVAALKAFGTTNFYSWYMAQLQLPTISEEHVRFLGDICRFITTGSHEFRLETWPYLLKTSSEGVRPFQPCQMARDFFCMKQGTTSPFAPEQFSLINVIQRWVSQPQGIEDLLGTLHLLFGNL